MGEQMTQTDFSYAVVVLGDVDTAQRAEMLASKAAESGAIIAETFAFGIGEAASSDDLAEVEPVVAALSRAIATRTDIWVPFWREDLSREEHIRRVSLVLQRHGINLRMGPQLVPCPTDGGYNQIDIALRAEVHRVDELDQAAMATAGVQTLATEIELALTQTGEPSKADSVDLGVRYFSTAEAARFFHKSAQWVSWAMRNNVFVHPDGSVIEPVRIGKNGRRRFTLPVLRDMARACYRRGILDEVELEEVLGDLARAER